MECGIEVKSLESHLEFDFGVWNSEFGVWLLEFESLAFGVEFGVWSVYLISRSVLNHHLHMLALPVAVCGSRCVYRTSTRERHRKTYTTFMREITLLLQIQQ